MSLYKYIREVWKKPHDSLGTVIKERLILWRKEPSTIKLDRPTRLDRARSLGYKAKQGIFVVRQRVMRGGRQRPTIRKGRRPKHFTQRKVLSKNYQQIAEERVGAKYKNCGVLNSYLVGQDGKSYWYEVIVVDYMHPGNVKEFGWMGDQKGRTVRGLTSAGRKARGLMHKGKGSEKARPSRTANRKRRKE